MTAEIKEILEMLRYSFSYIDFMTTLNEMVTTGKLRTYERPAKERKYLINEIHKLKCGFKEKFIKENPYTHNELCLIHIYGVTDEEREKIYEEVIYKPLINNIKYYTRLNKLKSNGKQSG